jgi:hypothetical protein
MPGQKYDKYRMCPPLHGGAGRQRAASPMTAPPTTWRAPHESGWGGADGPFCGYAVPVKVYATEVANVAERTGRTPLAPL